MRRTLAAIAGLALGATLSQFPEYAQQYVQRLGGAVDELRVITEDFDRSARDAGLSRESAIERFSETGDSFVGGRGQAMARTFERYDLLSRTLAEVEGATGWRRFAELPKYLDTEIGARTLGAYKPAIPVTVEGFSYAAAGFVLGYLSFSALLRFLMLPFRRRKPQTGPDGYLDDQSHAMRATGPRRSKPGRVPAARQEPRF